MFRNATIYQLPLDFTPPTEETIRNAAFKPCQGQQISSTGFKYFTQSGNRLFFQTMTETKLIPPAIVNYRVDEVVRKRNTPIPVNRRERAIIKEDVIHEMLPQAFSKHVTLWAFIDLTTGLLVIDTASPSEAERFNATLRSAIGSLPAVPWEYTPLFHDWIVARELPAPFEFGHYVKMLDYGDGSATVTFRNQDLMSDEIQVAVIHGKRPVEMMMYSADNHSFTLTMGNCIKSIKYLAEIEADDDPISTLVLYSGELLRLIRDLPTPRNSN